jgi:hypothetical protein
MADINTDLSDATENVDKILQIVIDEVNKIENNEETDCAYTKMIFLILIMTGLLIIKTKLYKIITCFKKGDKVK